MKFKYFCPVVTFVLTINKIVNQSVTDIKYIFEILELVTVSVSDAF